MEKKLSNDYIKEVLTKLGLVCEENVPDEDGNLCTKSDTKKGTLYVFASHPDKEFSNYHITFIVNGKAERCNTVEDGLEASIQEVISK